MLIHMPYVTNMCAILGTCECANSSADVYHESKLGIAESVSRQTVKSAAHKWKMAEATSIAKIRE